MVNSAPFTVHRLLLLLVATNSLWGGEPQGYYGTATNTTGAELRAALHAIIRPHTRITYDDAVDALKVLEEDPQNTNNVMLIYSRASVPKDSFPEGWNREHLWPRSLGIGNSTARTQYSDLFNLRPENPSINTSRLNRFYDISDPRNPDYLSPAHSNAPFCSKDSDSWEPPSNVKGDLARALLYMDVCYEGGRFDTNLMLTDVLGEIVSGTNLMGRLSTLIAWHLTDHVDSYEQLRNERVYALQQNRNPFVDHPEWVLAVFAPHLRVQRINTTIRLSWPALYQDAALQFLGDPPPLSGWFDLTPRRTNDDLYLMWPATQSIGLFRLMLR